ncbi:hypothetical protein WA158_007514 [Blastocystis sp. Blastoise]
MTTIFGVFLDTFGIIGFVNYSISDGMYSGVLFPTIMVVWGVFVLVDSVLNIISYYQVGRTEEGNPQKLVMLYKVKVSSSVILFLINCILLVILFLMAIDISIAYDKTEESHYLPFIKDHINDTYNVCCLLESDQCAMDYYIFNNDHICDSFEDFRILYESTSSIYLWIFVAYIFITSLSLIFPSLVFFVVIFRLKETITESQKYPDIQIQYNPQDFLPYGGYSSEKGRGRLSSIQKLVY